MGSGTRIRLMVLILYFSCIIHMNGATPVTRTSNLFQKSPIDEASDSRVLEMEKEGDEYMKEEKIALVRRMEVEVNDYPGSGANNRHTPRPQFGRGCVDC